MLYASIVVGSRIIERIYLAKKKVILNDEPILKGMRYAVCFRCTGRALTRSKIISYNFFSHIFPYSVSSTYTAIKSWREIEDRVVETNVQCCCCVCLRFWHGKYWKVDDGWRRISRWCIHDGFGVPSVAYTTYLSLHYLNTFNTRRTFRSSNTNDHPPLSPPPPSPLFRWHMMPNHLYFFFLSYSLFVFIYSYFILLFSRPLLFLAGISCISITINHLVAQKWKQNWRTWAAASRGTPYTQLSVCVYVAWWRLNGVCIIRRENPGDIVALALAHTSNAATHTHTLAQRIYGNVTIIINDQTNEIWAKYVCRWKLEQWRASST